MAEPLPAGRAIQHSGAPTERSASKPRKRGGRRGRRAQLVSRINSQSRERQEAWAAEHQLSLEEFKEVVRTGQRDLTRAMTSKLETLYEEHRSLRPAPTPGRVHAPAEMVGDHGKPRGTKKRDWTDVQVTENEIAIGSMEGKS